MSHVFLLSDLVAAALSLPTSVAGSSRSLNSLVSLVETTPRGGTASERNGAMEAMVGRSKQYNEALRGARVGMRKAGQTGQT